MGLIDDTHNMLPAWLPFKTWFGGVNALPFCLFFIQLVIGFYTDWLFSVWTTVFGIWATFCTSLLSLYTSHASTAFEHMLTMNYFGLMHTAPDVDLVYVCYVCTYMIYWRLYIHKGSRRRRPVSFSWGLILLVVFYAWLRWIIGISTLMWTLCSVWFGATFGIVACVCIQVVYYDTM
jgi:hypothetical protein